MKNPYYNYRLFNKDNITKPVIYKKDIFTLIYEGNLVATCKAIKNGDVNLYHRNDKGQTLLHWAILYNQTEIAKELIVLGASLDVADNKGNTVKDIINLHYPENRALLTIATPLLEESVQKNFVENEDTGLLGCINNHCEIF